MNNYKLLEAVIRAILFPESKIAIVGTDEKDSNKQYNKLKSLIEQHSDILNPEIKKVKGTEIKFKNGSHIQVTSPKLPEDYIRGRRAETGHWLYDFESCRMSKEELYKVLEPFMRDIDD